MKTSASFSALMFMVVMAHAETSSRVLDYAIPQDAVRIGPGHSRDPAQYYFNFFRPGSTPSKKTLIGRETYCDAKLIERELYKDGKRHGVWRKWHSSGQLESESPYHEDVKDGLFRQWDELGRLVGQYEIVNGSGVKRIYNSSGELVREQVIENSRPNGLSMEYLERFGSRSLVWMKNGDSIGKGFSFYRDWSVSSITWNSWNSYSTLAIPNGPHISYGKDGTVTKKQWYIRGNEVTEPVYAEAAANDASLPPYYADAAEYKQFVNAEVKTLLEKYRTMPRVKIPLEFDENGNPVPAPVQ